MVLCEGDEKAGEGCVSLEMQLHVRVQLLLLEDARARAKTKLERLDPGNHQSHFTGPRQ